MPSNFEGLDYDALFAEQPALDPETFQKEQEEELGFWGTVGDIGMGVVRGVSGAVENTLEIGQIFGLDYDLYDTDEEFGESETMLGSAAEGITQFLTGFIPGIGIVSKAGKVAGLAGKVGKVTKGLEQAGRTKSALAVARGSEAIKYATAGAIADFTVFDAHEQRLSNLIEQFPGLQNPVTDFLAADENDSEIEGRLKNAIEGMGLGFAIDGLLIGLKAMRKGAKQLPDKEAASKATQEETEKLVREGEVSERGLGKTGFLYARDENLDEVFPPTSSGSEVSGLKVREDVPNMGSIESSFTSYEVLPGVREVRMDQLGPEKYDITSESMAGRAERIQGLADEISQTKEINPLILAIDDKNGIYVLEGSHRIDALDVAGVESFPAIIVRDLDDLDPSKAVKNIEDLESGEEMLAAMRDLSKEELDEIAKDKSLNWRTLSDDPDVVKTLRIIGARNVALKEKAAEEIPEEVFLRRTTEATQAMKDAGIIAPGDITKVDDINRVAQEKAEEVRRASMFRHYMKEELDNLGSEIKDTAIKVRDNFDVNSAVEFLLFKKALQRLQFAYKSVSSEFGRGLQAHKISAGKMPVELDRMNLDELLEDQVAKNNLIESAGGIEKIQAEARKFLQAEEAGNLHKGMGVIQNKATLGGATIEYWLNSILSGPTTMAVNALSGVLTTAIAPVEKAFGAVMSGNLAQAGRELKRYVYLAESINDARKIAMMSLKENKATLDPLTSSIREGEYGPSQITNRMLDSRLANSSMGVEAARWVGGTVNLPSRFLTATDEFFKQVNYRSAMKAGLTEQAIKNGMEDPRQIAQYVEEQFTRLVNDGQFLARKKFTAEARQDPAIKAIEDPFERAQAIGEYAEAEMKKFSPLAEEAIQQARDVTFTTPLRKERGQFINISRNISNTVNDSPILRLVFPFVRTPANIIQYVMDRTPLTLLNKRNRDAFLDFKKQVYSDSPEIRQEAIGRMMMGTTFLATGYMLALNGNLTGGGPTSTSRRKVLQDAGWQPYSVKVGDKYVSYRRLDPFASFFGLMADIADAHANADEMTREDAEDVGMALLVSMAKNLTDKTYLTGMTRVSNALSNPERFGTMWMNSTVASFVPNILQQANRSLEQDVKDTNNLLDAIKARIPGFSDDVPPRRNMLGEPVQYQRAGIPIVDSISPFDYSETTSDPLKREFAQIGHGFSPPRHVKNGVNLQEFKSRSGQTAYDRWLELHGSVKIGGRSLRNALTRLIKSRSYKNLPYEAIEDLDKSPRVAAINRVVAKYRAKAFSQMLREYPEVKRRDEIGLLIKQNRRAGRDVSQLLALIEDTR